MFRTTAVGTYNQLLILLWQKCQQSCRRPKNDSYAETAVRLHRCVVGSSTYSHYAPRGHQRESLVIHNTSCLITCVPIFIGWFEAGAFWAD